MLIQADSVDKLFRLTVAGIDSKDIPTTERQSRHGKTLTIPFPVIFCLTNPLNRVMQNLNRDCNPFFHLFESMWMLAGRNDVASLATYNSNMVNYSDDGKIFHGAYGYRWRNQFGYDQLKTIIDELKENPNSRRCVLQMWDATANNLDYSTRLENGLQTGQDDLYTATHGGLDVPCNLCCTFTVREYEEKSCLDMTVMNRSNDLIWGLLGANVVHFSFLLEHVATQIGIPVGKQYHVSSNAHVYIDAESKWKPDEWLSHPAPSFAGDPVPLGELEESELQHFTDIYGKSELSEVAPLWDSDFLNRVAEPMMETFLLHKKRLYELAFISLQKVEDIHWQTAGMNWIERRKRNWEKKNV